MSKLTKIKGAKAKCNTCGDEMICVEIPAKGNFAAKLQWQNPEGGAHYNTVDGVNFTCNRKMDPIPQIATKMTEYEERKPIVRKTEDLFNEAVLKSDLSWDYAVKKAYSVYMITSTDEANSDLKRSVMILSQVFYKSMVELMK